MVTRADLEYEQPKMDSAAETYGSIDWGGNLLFAPGAKDYNKQIEKATRQLQDTQSDIAWENYEGAQGAADKNQGLWDTYANQLAPQLGGFYGDVKGRDRATTDQYVDAMGQWTNPADLFKDPAFMQYVGDAKNHAFRSDAAKSAQTDALSQLKGQTGLKETAQEKLMREMARRHQEQNERGNREAMNQNLKARGAYGSGAEILGNLMSAQGTGQQRSLENMQANANAQQRAMAALGQYTQAGAQLGSQDLQEGQMANQMDQFNNTLQQQYNNFKGQQQIGATNAGNTEQRTRATGVANAQLGQTGRERQDFGAEQGYRRDLASGGIDVGTNNQKMKTDAGGALSGELGKQVATLQSQAKDEGIFG
jgi:hypothetical protein